MSPASFYKTALYVAPFLFFISANVNLRGKYDLDAYCQSEEELNQYQLSELENFKLSTRKFFNQMT
jgi:hypothetical protein